MSMPLLNAELSSREVPTGLVHYDFSDCHLP